MKLILTLSIYLWGWSRLMAQEYHSHVFFANQSRLPIQLEIENTGQISMLESMKKDFLPYEITHDHSTTIEIGDLVGIQEKDHNEGNATLKIDRRRNFGNNNFTSKIRVLTEGEKLLTIHINGSDQSGPYVHVYYNIEYNDGTYEYNPPGKKMVDNNRDAQVAQQYITHDGEEYKLVFGVFNEKFDNTDNIIFSMSNLVDTIYRYDAPIQDTANPNVLHIVTYNPGILMPLNISDQDEYERAAVMHKALSKNMDVMVFQEFFEQRENQIILDNLKPWYPYQTNSHNKILIPGVGKEGGVRIVSKYPILEQDEISFIENGCDPDDFFSKFANKGVKYVKINKKGQILHIFGTHTSLQPCDLYVMGKFIADKNLPKDEVVIMAGDFNVDMNRYKNGSDDYTKMLDTLNALEPTYLSFLNDWTYTGTTSGLNHMYCCNPHGRQQLDYVLVSAHHKVPTLLTNRSLQARLNEPDESFGIFDMGDHEPVYARIEFPEIEQSSSTVNSCIGETVVLNTHIVKHLEDYEIEWARNGTIIENEKSEILIVQLKNFEDFGNYTATFTYEYFPDTVINNFYDPSYMDYHWYFRGKTKGEIVIEFEINPETEEENCNGISTNIRYQEWENLQLYPNPTQNYLILKGLNNNKVERITIIDLTGRTLQEVKIQNKENIEINAQSLSNGMYWLIGINDQGQAFRKSFVIQK